MTTRPSRTYRYVATHERCDAKPMPRPDRSQPVGHSHPDQQHGEGATSGEPPRPTEPSRAVLVDVGDRTGALVLTAPAERAGLEVEIHPVGDRSQRTHVWVLPRAGRDGTVYAAVFPSLPAGDYLVWGPDGSVATTVSVPANQVTNAWWG
jgi:hypothetical protein